MHAFLMHPISNELLAMIENGAPEGSTTSKNQIALTATIAIANVLNVAQD